MPLSYSYALNRRRIAEKGSSPEPDQKSVSPIRSVHFHVCRYDIENILCTLTLGESFDTLFFNPKGGE